MSEKVLFSQIARTQSGFRGIQFYSEKTGFGTIREGYASSNDRHCTIVEFPDLGGVSRDDTNHTALSAEAAPEIVREAVELVLPEPEEV